MRLIDQTQILNIENRQGPSFTKPSLASTIATPTALWENTVAEPLTIFVSSCYTWHIHMTFVSSCYTCI